MKKYIKWLFVFIFTLCLFSSLAQAEKDLLSTFEVEGANFTYDIETGNIVSNGVLILKSKNFYIEAEDVVFDTKNQLLVGKGAIKIDIGDTAIEGKGINIDFKNKKAEISKNVIVQGVENKKKWVIKGDTFLVKFTFTEDKKSIDEVWVKDGGEFTYDNLKGRAERIKYLPLQKKVILSGKVEVIKDRNSIIAESVTVDLATNKIFTKGKVKIIVNNR